MKLGSLIENEKLALDMTPLIDIVFLLVLFFAVSTSFISPEHLDELKKSLVSYEKDSDGLKQANQGLAVQVGQLQQTDAQQQNTIVQLQDDLTAALNSNQAKAQMIGQKTQLLSRSANTISAQTEAIEEKTNLLTVREQTIAEQNQTIEQNLSNLSVKARHITMLNERIIIEEHKQQDALSEFQKLLAVSTTKETALRNQLTQETQRADDLREILDAEQAAVKATIAKLDVGLRDLVANEQLGVKQVQNRVIIHLPDNVLFDSGSANIKRQGLTVLSEVGKLLKAKTAGMSIQVGGHTDDVPLGAENQKIYLDNWGLSSNRAVNVVRFFQQNVGIASQKLSAAGYGYYRPIAENTTASGRKLNRRIEIVLLPE